MFLEIHRKASNIFNNQRLLGVCTIALMLSPSSMLSSSKVFFESNKRPSKEVSLKKRKEKYLQRGRKLVLPWVFADHAFLSIPRATQEETVTKNTVPMIFECICCASFPPLDSRFIRKKRALVGKTYQSGSGILIKSRGFKSQLLNKRKHCLFFTEVVCHPVSTRNF